MAISEPVRSKFAHGIRHTVEPSNVNLPASEMPSRAAQDALKLTDAAGVAIAIEHNGEIRCAATAGNLALAIGARVDRNDGITGECVTSRISLRCDDTRLDSRVNSEQCARAGILSVAVVPVLHGVQVVGVIEAFSRRATAFTDSHVQQLESIAAEIGRSHLVRDSSARGVTVSFPISSGDVRPRPHVDITLDSKAATPLSESSVTAPGTTATDVSRHSHIKHGLVVTAMFLIAALGYFLVPRFPQREAGIAPTPSSAPTPAAAAVPTPPASAAPERSEPPAEMLQAAEAGDAVAQYRTALFYLSSGGSGLNDAQALRWLKRAAENGQANAQYRLATAYVEGAGVSPNPVEAYAWYILAQSNGYGDAAETISTLTPRLTRSDIANVRFRVGQMYARGEGTRVDVVSAYAWLALAQSAGHPSARETKAQLAKQMNVQQLADATARASSWLARHRPALPRSD